MNGGDPARPRPPRDLGRLLGRMGPGLRPFYRRYPFHGPVSLRSADRRGCVDTRLGVFYNRIPKAANSTVVVNLAAQRWGRDIPSKAAKKLFRRPSELTRDEVADIECLFCFTFVRNPYTRVLSAYLDKVERKARMRGSTSSFDEFLRYLDRGGLYDNMHWAPQCALLLLPLDRFEFVGRVERLDTDLATALAHIRGEGAHGDLKAALGNQTGASRKVAEYYTARACERVRRLYRQDFEAFGYDPDLAL